jgi:lysylphosphatidylglycerol synthetase-like protein (DUF2156 family)
MPGWLGGVLRAIGPVIVVFLTWNPDGWSYYQWAIQPLVEGNGGFDAVKFLAGTLIIAAWVVILQATRRSMGPLGMLLVAAICAGVIWWLIGRGIVTARSSRGIANVVLISLGIVLSVGLSWSHISRRLTGQADTDVVD